MASVTITLQTEGSEAGNYSIYHTSIDPANLIESGVDSATLFNGYCTEDIYNTYIVQSNTAGCDYSQSINLDVVPTPNPVPVPVSTPTITDGWSFVAGAAVAFGYNYVGFHTGTEISGSNLFHGTGNAPTTTTVSIDDYQTSFLNIIGGTGIIGFGPTASQYALTTVDQSDAPGDSPTMGLTLNDASTNPGNISLSGTIEGSNGSSGNWSATFIPTTGGVNGDGVPYNPESIADNDVTGGSFTLPFNLVNGVTYYMNIT